MILSYIAALQIAAVAAPTVPAVIVETTTTSETSGAASGGPPGVSSRSVMTVSGKNFRMDELERTGPASPMSKAGTSMIMRGDDRKMFTIDSAKKEYYELDIAKVQSQLSAMLKSMPGMEMKFSDLKSDVEDLGDDQSLLGHPTRHYRIKNGLTMNAVMMAESLSVSMETTSDTWYAKDIVIDQAALSPDTSMLTQFRELIPGVDASRFREMIAKLPRLVPLKSVTTTASYFGPMDVTVKITQLATRVEKKQVPAKIFEIPAGYKKVEMPDLMIPQRQ